MIKNDIEVLTFEELRDSLDVTGPQLNNIQKKEKGGEKDDSFL